MTLRSFNGKQPVIGSGVYIDDTALVIGDVTIGADASLWPMVVVRGDQQPITIGCNTNIQDGTVIHITHAHARVPGGLPTVIGDDVTVGHRALLHACVVGNRCLIGMAAVVMDGAVIEDQVVVAGGALVTPGKVLEGGSLYAGAPARRVRALSEDELGNLVYSARHYVELKNLYLAGRSQAERSRQAYGTEI